MKVVILIDNNPDSEGIFLTEHGISIYFDADGLKWLFDVGASPDFAINARKMGVEIEDIDYLILSHAHRDHTGGLEYFLRRNKKARVIMTPVSNSRLFVSYRKQIKHDITINYKIVSDFADRFIFAESNLSLSANVTIIQNIPKIDPLPKANCLLFGSDENGEYPDDFRHEIALTVRVKEGIVLFSGCSHHGILNILRAASQIYKEETLAATIGGTHLLDSDWNDHFETTDEISGMANTIAQQYPNMRLITGHCTGRLAKRQFSAILSDRFQLFNSGTTYYFDDLIN